MGSLWVTIQFAKDLRSVELFGRQDPYCVIKTGCQAFRTHVAHRAGANPVWNETFEFSCVQSNSIEVLIKDWDRFRGDELIGTASICLDNVKCRGSDHVNVPVFSGRKGKAKGYLAAVLVWAHPTRAQPEAQAQAQAQPQAPTLARPVSAHAAIGTPAQPMAAAAFPQPGPVLARPVSSPPAPVNYLPPPPPPMPAPAYPPPPAPVVVMVDNGSPRRSRSYRSHDTALAMGVAALGIGMLAGSVAGAGFHHHHHHCW
ncbi:hypothetical protein HYH03_007174 [Edaphochlamys debaryana]|uniref:C2 domain-containing protein n=1 Tax=Edaphochlamys debaryana TaxID=47281 RepID=A0A835Y2D0_9CHLO|nr:hypothetical protein HYH03_007174 [Edaphochlamys debaryana]|eukprot:KAG2494658.1 hypothetical protein HYH03_007174 [Edaphochlamys debaryana]